ncbi:MAG: diguanylate cyclase [Planctomycetes bacterium]|nr:diguanylate cyclase [Planctomycetota bacterium]
MQEPTATAPQNVLQVHFDSTVDGQYVLDPETDVFIKVNQAFCDLLGYTAEQLVEARAPISTMSVVHPDDREDVLKRRNAASGLGEHGTLRFRVVKPDSTVRYLEITYSVISFMGRRLHMGSARDVSEQVKLENKLRNESEFNRELSLAAQRSAKEAERQKIEALMANTRVGALAEVLRAVPVLTKRLLEIEKIDDIFKETTVTLYNEAGCSHCYVLMKNNEGDLQIKYSSPYRATDKLTPDSNGMYQTVLRAIQNLAIDESGTHVAPIRVAGEIRGLLEVGMPKNLQRFYTTQPQIQQSLRDLVVTIADFLGLVISDHENLQRITLQSRQDKLTGLANRRVFEEQITTEFRRAVRYERDLALLMLDIDHFKKVNDTYGHQQGDRVLAAIGGLLKHSFRDLDTVCRYGGEEMCAILPETVGEAARAKAEYVRRKVEELVIPIMDKPDETMKVTASIGVACLTRNTSSEEQLLREADRALYECKTGGRNRVILAKA